MMNRQEIDGGFGIRAAGPKDVPIILGLIRELAEFEKLSHEVVATEEKLLQTLFNDDPVAKVLIGELNGEAVGFTLFFYSYSTFLAKPGIYLEDLYVKPAFRGRGFGKALLTNLARIACEKGCGRLEWSCLDWNENAIRFYRSMGAVPLNEWTVFRLTGEALTKAGARLCESF